MSVDRIPQGDDDFIDLLGDEVDVRVIGPYREGRRLDIHAYHDGVGPAGRDAFLALEVNGQVLGTHEDHSFNSYKLTVDKRIALDPGATAFLLIRYTNNTATTTRHGIHVRQSPV
jgi:hypothetical protein